jgi:hypothetical protein
MIPSSSAETSPIAVRSRRISASTWQDIQEPRPPGGWNTLERFASSYTRSATFFPMDTTSPASFSRFFPDEEYFDSAVIDDEETSLISARVTRQSTFRSPVGMDDSENRLARVMTKPSDDGYGTMRGITSRRESILTDHGGPELLIKQVEDESGNIVEVVVGQVSIPISW